MIKWLVRVRYKAPALVFPWNCTVIKKILVILPEGPVDAFHQIKTYMGLKTLFKNAAFSVFCTHENALLFQQIHPEASMAEYDVSQRYLFSREFRAWEKKIHAEEFDLCVLLEHFPHISLLSLAGKTASPIRAGYEGSGGWPFLNVRVNPSPEKKYLSDRNFMIAQIFGASDKTKSCWSVAKETIEEIAHMLLEFHLSPTTRLVGIDAGLFYSKYGETWTMLLFNTIKTAGIFTCYIYNDGEPDEATFRFFQTLAVPVFANLTPSRSAALISKSACVISGKTVFFELANLLKKPVIGLFDKNEIERYCLRSPSTYGIVFDASPGPSTVEHIVNVLQTAEGRVRP